IYSNTSFLSFVTTLERRVAGNRVALSVLHARFRLSVFARKGRPMEGAHSSGCAKPVMVHSGELRSGKGSHDENFPVAARLIKRRHGPVILAFYEFVRVADDIADHPDLSSAEKISRLDRLESSLLGNGGDEPEGLRLREVLSSRGLSPRHAQDLLSALRQDATKLRYANWDELIDYCSRSAMP